MNEDTMNEELFKFLQLKEHASCVKLTQEEGQKLFAHLFDHANAIAHEEVSGDGAPTDSAQLILCLVNNLINAAKPAPVKLPLIIKLELSSFIEKNAAHMELNKLPLLSGENYFIDGINEADALRILGEPAPSKTSQKVWYFEIDGIVCRIFPGHDYGMVLNIARGTLINTRKKLVDDITNILGKR